MAPSSKPFQLLEINIISAQDLEHVSNSMRTYATAWVNPNRKLSSCVDSDGKNNPTWNDKFVFRVDEQFLRQDSSAVMIELYSTHWFRDKLVGTVRVLVGNLFPPQVRSQSNHIGMRFVALQVRRPSGRPQGILNIGVALLGGSMKGMALYRQLSCSAVGYRNLMDDPQQMPKNETYNSSSNVKPILRRSRSERSEKMQFGGYSPGSSVVAMPVKQAPKEKESSIISISDKYIDPFKGMKKKGKASSVINGAELRPKLIVKKKSKASSVISDSILSSKSKNENSGMNNMDVNKVDEKSEFDQLKPPPPPFQSSGKPLSRYNSIEPKGKYPLRGGSIWSDSEVGPSPSEVAAAIAQKRYPIDDNQSSVLDGWSLDESVEGLKSKLERWRTELPALYDRGGMSTTSSFKSSGQHARSKTDPGAGLFSCFGNIAGYECQCVCGKPPEKKNRRSRFRSPSVGTSSFL